MGIALYLFKRKKKNGTHNLKSFQKEFLKASKFHGNMIKHHQSENRGHYFPNQVLRSTFLRQTAEVKNYEQINPHENQ